MKKTTCTSMISGPGHWSDGLRECGATAKGLDAEGNPRCGTHLEVRTGERAYKVALPYGSLKPLLIHAEVLKRSEKQVKVEGYALGSAVLALADVDFTPEAALVRATEAAERRVTAARNALADAEAVLTALRAFKIEGA